MDQRQLDLSRYRLEKARDDLNVSQLTFDNNNFSQSINRSYYSMFHTLRALLALEQYDSKKHSGIISYFAKYFVKTGKIETKYFKMLTAAFKIRNNCDYDDFYVASREDARQQLDNAMLFIKRLENVIEEIIES